jgi:phage terminase Nu1 subunit (DNA packaging protein)
VTADDPEPTPLPVREPERYVSRRELADLMGVSVDTVDRMVREGCPSETWGRRFRRFLASDAIAWGKQQGESEERS